MNEFLVNIQVPNLISKSSLSDIIAFCALAVSIFTYRQLKKGNDTFKESLMSDAYGKTQEFVNSLSCIENALFPVSRLTIGGIDIAPDYGRFVEYKTQDQFRERVIHRMKLARYTGEAICRAVNALTRLNSDLEKLSYSLSKNNAQTLKELIELGLEVDHSIQAYVDLVFDYFDDEEFCQSMRYSQHIFTNNEISIKPMLEIRLTDSLERIYKISDQLSKICQKLSENKISELYQYK